MEPRLGPEPLASLVVRRPRFGPSLAGDVFSPEVKPMHRNFNGPVFTPKVVSGLWVT